MARPSKNTPIPLPDSITPLGERLSRIRKLKGFTQASLAEAMCISIKQISDYETGKVNMNHEMLIRFAITLKVSADTLLGLKLIDIPEETPNTRFTKRLKELENLPESKKRTVVKILDEFIGNE